MKLRSRLSAHIRPLWQKGGVYRSRRWWMHPWRCRCLWKERKPPAGSSRSRRQNIPLRSQEKILSSRRKAGPPVFYCGQVPELVYLTGQ